MRIHVLGAGAVGTLISFHLKRTARRLATAIAEVDPKLASREGLYGQSLGSADNGEPSSSVRVRQDSTSEADAASRRMASQLAARDQALRNPTDLISDFPHLEMLRHLTFPANIGVNIMLSGFAYRRAQHRSDYGLVVERDGVRQRENNFGLSTFEHDIHGDRVLVQSAKKSGAEGFGDADDPETAEALGLSVLEAQGYPDGSIDTLIVVTKANQTVAAIREMAHLITPASTIVLLHNGQGVFDSLINQIFTDPEKRPHFVLASTTHGAWSKGTLYSVHAAHGRIDLGIVPSPTLGSEYERFLTDQPVEEDDELREKDGSSNAGQNEQEQSGKLARGESPRSLRRKRRLRELNQNAGSLPLLDLDAIPANPQTSTLVQTMAMLLNMPLSVYWHPIRHFQLVAMRKLAINACINPLTALANCRNGELFGNEHAERLIRDICKEISNLLIVLVERANREKTQETQEKRAGAEIAIDQIDDVEDDGEAKILSQAQRFLTNPLTSTQDYLYQPNALLGDPPNPGAPMLDQTLSADALFKEVQRVVRLTAPNFSSMRQDIENNRKGETEVRYINGYISRLGRALQVPTPVNDSLVSLVQLRGITALRARSTPKYGSSAGK